MDEVVESVLRGGRLKVKGTEVMRRAWLRLGVLEKLWDYVKRMERPHMQKVESEK